ncbi:RluA family pseudouridine synthase [Maridesulfovibrio salexigens]|uniref:Pseudouridine synthase n=1 Tax=Maridesulfovibrio salexigens (strain ATCC 14822 / DSM 2638 / NCIMB 8403 / VKM B-1763) TaxID=526222 RepID=C6C294_MARSD|nr:RluA family pseudouridine synthase [Maridesulfovibrio salexigens]ACS81295.1 pseudouridine synthase [Maridesulfovibrio salexigens DSM 2638]
MAAEFVQVTKAEAGQKLVRFLERRVDGAVPRSAIMRWIRKGNVRVDKGRCKPFDLVKEGQTVRIPPYKAEETAQHKKLPELPIIYEDDNYLAVCKPAGLPTQGGTGHDDSVADRLLSMFADAHYKPAPAHRLDRDTSGVILAGKSHQGQKDLSDFFAEHGEGGKFYLAEVEGRWPEEDWVELHDKMEKSGSKGREKVVVGSGKDASSSVCPVTIGEKSSLLIVKLHTGRTHQIRVQLSSRGFPIAGDVKYGGQNGKMKLHCLRIDTPWFSVGCLPDWEKLPDISDHYFDKHA